MNILSAVWQHSYDALPWLQYIYMYIYIYYIYIFKIGDDILPISRQVYQCNTECTRPIIAGKGRDNYHSNGSLGISYVHFVNKYIDSVLRH